MKNFFKQLRDSVYGPDYYSLTIVPGTLWESVKYYLKLVCVVSLVTTILLSAFFLPQVAPLLRQGGEKIISYYPSGLEIYIKDGKASTNMVEPYIMPVPEEVRREMKNVAPLANLLVIDTKNPFSIEQFENYNTAVLLKQDAVYYYRKYEVNDGKLVRGETALQSLSQVPNTTINKDFVLSLLARILPVVKILVPLLVPVIFLGICLILLWLLIQMILSAFLIWLVAKLRGIALTYRQAYQVSAHAITLPLFVYCLMFPLAVTMPPFTFTLVLVIIAHLNLPRHRQAALPLA